MVYVIHETKESLKLFISFKAESFESQEISHIVQFVVVYKQLERVMNLNHARRTSGEKESYTNCFDITTKSVEHQKDGQV